mmetsp:Transcript_29760/g.39104  ORF Transcript_29760/g.39104 Transcript_29760/m.39104 type:complete len:157 (+) Transcript_29760:80-550(+)
MLQYQIILLASCIFAVFAFIPNDVMKIQHSQGILRSNTGIFSTMEKEIFAAEEAAMKASKEFGPQSPEARVAWEAVEEMNASKRGQNAMLQNLKGNDKSDLCGEFDECMVELEELIQQNPTIDDLEAKLIAENKRLLAENRDLREEISRRKRSIDM